MVFDCIYIKLQCTQNWSTLLTAQINDIWEQPCRLVGVDHASCLDLDGRFGLVLSVKFSTFYFWDGVSLSYPGCLWTHIVATHTLKLQRFSLPISWSYRPDLLSASSFGLLQSMEWDGHPSESDLLGELYSEGHARSRTGAGGKHQTKMWSSSCGLCSNPNIYWGMVFKIYL